MYNYDNTIKRLNLQTLDIKIMDIMESDSSLRLSVKRCSNDFTCPYCGEITSYHYDTNQNYSKIRHCDFYGKTIFLMIQKRRFKCLGCNKIITEQIQSISPYQRTTNDFEKNVLSELSNKSFKSVQNEFKIQYSFLKNKLFKYVKTDPLKINWEHHFKNETNIVMGIDEHSSKKKKFALTITNITKHELITILPNYSQKSLESFLRSIPSQYRKKINYVAIDFTNRYSKVIKFWLKNAEIVGDHFHLIAIANNLLWNEKRVLEGIAKDNKVKHFKLLLKAKEKLTQEEKEKIEVMLNGKQRQKLKLAYDLKEELRTALRDKDFKNGKQKFLEILKKDVWNRENLNRIELMKYSKYYRTFIETLKKWKTEIINFIETRITNAFTEGVHTKIKLIKRLSYGIPKTEIYIRRMILAFFPLVPLNLT